MYTTKAVPANTAASLRSAIHGAAVKQPGLKAGSGPERHVAARDDGTVVYIRPESAERL